MSEERKKPKYRYIAASMPNELHCVFVVHEESPDWYRLVATFRNAARAKDYVDMENEFARDPWWADGGLPDGREGDDQPAPATLPEPPASALIPGQVVRREAVEAAAMAPKTTIAPAATTALIDAVTLEPVTEKQAKVFAALLTGKSTDLELRTATGFSNVFDALSALKAKGYADRSGALGSTRWHPTAFGTPLIADASAIRRAWSADDLQKLHAGCTSGTDFIEIAKATHRTPAACQTQASVRGWYSLWAAARRDLPKPAQDETATTSANSSTALIPAEIVAEPGGPILPIAPPVSSTAPASAKGRPSDSDSGNPGSTPGAGASEIRFGPKDRELTTGEIVSGARALLDDETVTINDLSSRAKVVLKAIAQLEGAEPKYFSHGNIAYLAGIEVGRVQFQIDRLRDLLCIEPAFGGYYLPTTLGRGLAETVPVLKSLGDLHEHIRLLKPVRKPARAVAKPATPQPQHGNGGHGGNGDSRLDVVMYLERKGMTVSRLSPGAFLLNGAKRGISDILMLVNSHRRMADLDALNADEVW